MTLALQVVKVEEVFRRPETWNSKEFLYTETGRAVYPSEKFVLPTNQPGEQWELALLGWWKKNTVGSSPY